MLFLFCSERFEIVGFDQQVLCIFWWLYGICIRDLNYLNSFISLCYRWFGFVCGLVVSGDCLLYKLLAAFIISTYDSWGLPGLYIDLIMQFTLEFRTTWIIALGFKIGWFVLTCTYTFFRNVLSPLLKWTFHKQLLSTISPNHNCQSICTLIENTIWITSF